MTTTNGSVSPWIGAGYGALSWTKARATDVDRVKRSQLHWHDCSRLYGLQTTHEDEGTSLSQFHLHGCSRLFRKGPVLIPYAKRFPTDEAV